jgi:Zn-finger nucleic acid-binding protein
MNCVSCGAPLSATSDKCEHCDTLNDTDFRRLGEGRVEAAAETSEDLRCPRCQTELMALNIAMGDRYGVHRCKKCLGTFFRSEDLEKLVLSVAEGQSLDEKRIATLCKESPREVWPIAYIPCPQCRQTMHRKSFGEGAGVICDRCKEHGVWLDGGELGKLMRWARAGGVHKGLSRPFRD